MDTCEYNSGNEISRKFPKDGYDVNGCRNLCKEDNECMFFYVNDKGYCSTYKSCSKRITPKFSGTLYRKPLAGNINIIACSENFKII